MTRNQLYAIKLVHMLDSGMLCKVVYNCYDDSVLCEFESEKPCVYLIKEDFTDEQAEHEYRKCIFIIKKMKRNLLFKNPSLLFNKKKMTRNQKLIIKLINKAEKGMDIDMTYESQTDRIEFNAYASIAECESEYIQKNITDEEAEWKYKRFLSKICYIND